MEWKRLSIVRRHKSRGIMTWYLRENSSGRVKYKSLGTTNRKVAEECLHRLLVLRFALPGERVTSIPLNNAVEDFLARPNLCAGSIGQYSRIVGHFVKWCRSRGVMNALDIDDRLAKQYYAELEGKAAVHRCKVCGCFLKWVFRENRVDRAEPFKFVEYRKCAKAVRDSWSVEDVDKIVSAAPSREMRMLWAFMAYAGLRIHEAAKVVDGDIYGTRLRVMGKGRKMAILPISDKLSLELMRFGSLGAGLGINKQKSIRELSKVCEKLGIFGWVSNHKFRHSFATNLATSGCPVAVAMRLLRHSSSAMTLDVYSHVVPEDMRIWVDRI